MPPTLTYFDIRGRAEPIRLLLHLCGVDYVDRRIPFETWGELKPTLPFGALPVYEDAELQIPQAIAILYYLAEQHDLLGQTPKERSRVRVTIEACRDLTGDLSSLYWSSDFAEKRDPFLRDVLPRRLAQLDVHLRSGESTAHWAGGSLSCADCHAWAALNAVAPLAPELLAAHAALYEFKRRFEARSDVAAYLDHPTRPPTYTLSFASFGGTPETSGR